MLVKVKIATDGHQMFFGTLANVMVTRMKLYKDLNKIAQKLIGGAKW